MRRCAVETLASTRRHIIPNPPTPPSNALPTSGTNTAKEPRRVTKSARVISLFLDMDRADLSWRGGEYGRAVATWRQGLNPSAAVDKRDASSMVSAQRGPGRRDAGAIVVSLLPDCFLPRRCARCSLKLNAKRGELAHVRSRHPL